MAHSQTSLKVIKDAISWHINCEFCGQFLSQGWKFRKFCRIFLELFFLLFYKKQEKRKLGPDGREFLYVPLKGSLSRSPFSGPPWELPTTTGEEICGSVSLLLLFIFFNIVACVKGAIGIRLFVYWSTINDFMVWDSKALFNVFLLFELHLRRLFINEQQQHTKHNIPDLTFLRVSWPWTGSVAKRCSLKLPDLQLHGQPTAARTWLFKSAR